jgi:S1-C subfamily serine protease
MNVNILKLMGAVSVLALSVAVVRADRITLNNGTVLEGKTIPQGDGYWIKLADGSTQIVPKSDIKTIQRGAAAPSDSASPSPSSPAPSPTDNSFAAVKRRADAVRAPMGGVALWQQFIDSKPNADDLKAAKEQLAQWQKLLDAGAVKVKGRWITGDELAQFEEKVKAIRAEYIDLMRSNQTLAAVKKLQEWSAVEPDSYQITFELGYMSMLQRDYEKATKYFEDALRISPGLSSATGNIGLCLIFKNHLMEGLMKLNQAAEQGDCPELSHDLTLALSHVPPQQHDSDRLKQVASAAALLQAKYAGFPDKYPPTELVTLPLRAAPQSMAAGMKMWSGTGFLISADGLILTNRHVAKDAKTLMVTLDGGAKTTAQVVNIDDEQDLALLKIDPDVSKHICLKFSSTDQPHAGADCTVMGFPLLDRLGTNIKVTRGIVTGVQTAGLDADVLVDAKVNPGNSGGPMIDKYGDVMAIVCMKTLSNTKEDTYGIGISAGLIRHFLEKSKVAIKPEKGDGPGLSTEDIAAKTKPATVMIFATE